MKWLIIQSDGEHKGQDNWAPNWFLRECYSLQDALIRHGQLAHIWGLRHDNFSQRPDFNSYDFVLVAENYDFDWIYGIPDLYRNNRRTTLIQWVIDFHCQPHTVYTKLDADIYLHATRPLIAEFQSFAPKARHIWFPNAVDDRYFRPKGRTKETDILFIGGGGPRRPVIDAMVQQAGLTYTYGVTGYDYISALQKAKIGFNSALNGDINYRTFETLAVGTCLLTQHDPCLTALGFHNGNNCVMWYTVAEAIQLTKDLLRTGLWRGIGVAGYALSKQHTYEQRIGNLLKQI